MPKYEFKHLDPISVGKVTSIISAILGLINGILASLALQTLASLIGGIVGAIPIVGANAASATAAAQASNLLGAVSSVTIIAFPILGLIIGFLGGAIGAIIYNLTARFIGGIHVGMVEMEEPKPEKK